VSRDSIEIVEHTHIERERAIMLSWAFHALEHLKWVEHKMSVPNCTVLNEQ